MAAPKRRAPPPGSKGFTLIELMVVVLILGILAAIGIPQYLKTVETSKADDAVATVNMIAQSNRMYNVNNGEQATAWATGEMDNATNALVTNKYLAAANWAAKPYTFYACNPSNGNGGGCCAATFVACAQRAAGANATYQAWGYTVDYQGTIAAVGGAPEPSAQ